MRFAINPEPDDGEAITAVEIVDRFLVIYKPSKTYWFAGTTVEADGTVAYNYRVHGPMTAPFLDPLEERLREYEDDHDAMVGRMLDAEDEAKALRAELAQKNAAIASVEALRAHGMRG